MKFNEHTNNLLKTLDKFTDKAGDLLKQNIKDSSEKFDRDLIKLLLSDKDTKEHFFDEIDDATIFNYRKFIDYIDDKNFLIDSYTKFSNKVGLTLSNKHLQQINDVVLSFPFKDCVLEGGQSKDDEKRKEIFFNEVLAKDEINRLLDEKVITNAKKYTTDGVSDDVGFNRDENGLIKDNLIIKGNNLLALHTLKSNFAGKVKLIYIDPPYNTGNDSFNYNDNFNHSTWLTFMKNRLEVARELLSDDGVIFVQCDHSPSDTQESPELPYLSVLMDEIFGRKNYVTSLIWKKKSNASNTESNIGTITEPVLMYAKEFTSLSVNLQEYKRSYRHTENGKAYNIEQPVKTNSGAYERKTMLYSIKTKEGIFSPPDGKRWTIGEDTAKKYVLDDKHVIINDNFYIKKFESDYKKGGFKLHNNLLDEHGSLKTAKNELANLGFNREDFDTPKPEKLLERIIEISTQKGDLVLDYHLGSGTTCTVSHKMGRQYIGIEQMDYIEDITVKRMQKVIEGEQGGISKAVEWQGGGEFIYFELDKYNQKYINELSNATNKTILKLYDEILEKAFLNYDVEVKKLTQEKGEFKTLSLNEQQEFLISILNKNQLYNNLSEIDDKDLGINNKTKTFNEDFYNGFL